jgi:F-box interacting protein
MESGTAAMAMAEATPPRRCLPEEIVVWEILVRLPAKSLLRCRAVCCAWLRATSTRDFLLSHHGRQPTLPIVWGEPDSGFKYEDACYNELLAFDHWAADAKLQTVARVDQSYYPKASCDGLLILSKRGMARTCYSVCNPTTRQHAPLPQLSGYRLLGMYQHRPSGEYRLLLRWTLSDWHQISTLGCYVFTLGSDQPPRYIEGLKVEVSAYLHTPALVRDSLHWYLGQKASKLVIVFDNTSESFRQMRAPAVPTNSYIFEMDATLGIYSYSHYGGNADIWVLQNYESEVWEHEYRVQLPVTKFERLNESWTVSVVSVDDAVLLLVSHGGWMFYVNTDGKLVDSFHRDGQAFYACELRLKQTLVPHTVFTALERYDANASPFV